MHFAVSKPQVEGAYLCRNILGSTSCDVTVRVFFPNDNDNYHPPFAMSNASLRAEVYDLTLSISRHKLLLDEMQTRLQKLQTRLNSITYPVLTLPPEITSEIFLVCLPDEREYDVVNPREAPLLLTHVCSAWRQIAISLPRLWTTFDVVCATDVPDLFNIAKTWLERSQNFQISIKIHGALTSVQDLHSLLKTLRQHSSRMRSLDLNVDLRDFYAVDFRTLDLVLLQTLSIRLFDMDVDDDLVAEFGHVPLLREALVGVIPPSLITLPWQQLTKFTGEVYTAAQCLEALTLMPNLLECAFSVSEDDEDDDDLEVHSHPSIQHFALFESESPDQPTCSARLLEFITFPALQTLEVRVEDFDEEELDSFLERSHPPLQKLCVRSLDGSTQLQFSSLGMASVLTELEIWHPSNSFLPDFIDFLAYDHTFLPQLRSLALRGCRVEQGELTLSEILELVATPITERRDL
ncbi:hypothetical protein C8F04DRAFT_990434, partial [Mycena alexandri]